MNSQECLAARALLDMRQAELASRAGVGLSTLANFEDGYAVGPALVEKVRSALQVLGIEFVRRGNERGVRHRATIQPLERNKISTRQLKAARALLGWHQAQLATASGVVGMTIRRLESRDVVVRGREETIAKVMSALDRAGVRFVRAGVLIAARRQRASGVEVASNRNKRAGRTEAIAASQSRAARVLLDLTQGQLAAQASLGLEAVVDFENVRREQPVEVAGKIQSALESLGIEFIKTKKELGVRLSRSNHSASFGGVWPAQLKAARKLAGLNQRDFSAKTGILITTIRKIEQSDTPLIQAPQLQNDLIVALGLLRIRLVGQMGVVLMR